MTNAGSRQPNFLFVMADQLAAPALPIYGAQGGQSAPHCPPGRERRGLRQRVLQFADLRPFPLLDADGTAADGDRRLRQRQRVPGLGADPGALPGRGGLPDDPGRQDALHRSGPAARVRRAADDRHLPGRFLVDTRTGAPGRADKPVGHQHAGRRPRRGRACEACRWTTTTRSSTSPSSASTIWRAMRSASRSSLTVSFTSPASALHDPPRATGTATGDEDDRHAGGRPTSRSSSATCRASGCMSRTARTSRPSTDEQVRNARHAYYGMITYVDDKVGRLLDDAGGVRSGARTLSSCCARGPRRDAGRTRHVVQAELLRVVGARAAGDCTAPGAHRAAPRAASGLPRGPAADARSISRPAAVRLQMTDPIDGAQPRAAAGSARGPGLAGHGDLRVHRHGRRSRPAG